MTWREGRIRLASILSSVAASKLPAWDPRNDDCCPLETDVAYNRRLMQILRGLFVEFMHLKINPKITKNLNLFMVKTKNSWLVMVYYYEFFLLFLLLLLFH